MDPIFFFYIIHEIQDSRFPETYYFEIWNLESRIPVLFFNISTIWDSRFKVPRKYNFEILNLESHFFKVNHMGFKIQYYQTKIILKSLIVNPRFLKGFRNMRFTIQDSRFPENDYFEIIECVPAILGPEFLIVELRHTPLPWCPSLAKQMLFCFEK